MQTAEQPSSIALPDIPAMIVTNNHAIILSPDGELQTLSHDRAKFYIHGKQVLVCHAPYTRSKLDLEEFYAFDVLELFAFVHPVLFTVPTPHGLCRSLHLKPPPHEEDIPLSLFDIAKTLLLDLQNDPWKAKADPLKIAQIMGLNGKGWPWTPYIFEALGTPYDKDGALAGKADLNIWRHLPEWSEEAPPPPPGHEGVSEQEAHERLSLLLGRTAESRPTQREYSTKITHIFQPMQNEETPSIAISEAGTGIGKTLGYLAPASVWSEKNQGAVWISTYTKNLQRQIDRELSRLYPDMDIKDRHVAIRKGRENYLCLLNFEDMAGGASLAHNITHAVAAGIMARWAAASRDGDLSGDDFPGWLSGLLGYRYTGGLADRRGECIFSACDHYHRCFVERSIRKSKRASIVVANHALVMIQAAMATAGDEVPTRLIFDEGHHLFQAADSAFAGHLTAKETRDLRRWLLGAEGGKRSRARGLQKRIEDLISDDPKAMQSLQAILFAAQSLPTEGWSKRITQNAAFGAAEQFLSLVMQQVHARADDRAGPYSLEVPVHPVLDALPEYAKALQKELQALQKPMQHLAKHLHQKLEDDEGTLESDTKKRLESVAKSLERRASMSLNAWIGMLETLLKPESQSDEFVDWFEIERIDGKPVDVGFYRHYTDPMKPFTAAIQSHIHGMAVTSATLKDGSDGLDGSDDWDSADIQTGSHHMKGEIEHSSFPSSFDYGQRTKVLILSDVRKEDMGQVAKAYEVLFKAAKGGALGIFTAIQRLKAVHDKIAAPLDEHHIPLYAQHVDAVDTGSLIDMFRDQDNACLLGTDAIRDGVDVPGRSLRLLVFDRVPWPRPTILHKARRNRFGGRQYDEMLTRMKLKQAYGRLIRKAEDRGIFVMMDSMFPSRLHNAFPDDVEIIKCGLAEARNHIETFFTADDDTGTGRRSGEDAP